MKRTYIFVCLLYVALAYGVYKLRDEFETPLWPLLVAFLGLGTLLVQLSKLRDLPEDNWRFKHFPFLKDFRQADQIPVWARILVFALLFGGPYLWLTYT